MVFITLSLHFHCVLLIIPFALCVIAHYTGKTVLIENIEETLDPVLDSLLGRNLIKKGKLVENFLN